jgi:hypothetical protein
MLLQEQRREHDSFRLHPERTAEGVVYELDTSGLMAAGLDPSRMKQLPAASLVGFASPFAAHARAVRRREGAVAWPRTCDGIGRGGSDLT